MRLTTSRPATPRAAARGLTTARRLPAVLLLAACAGAQQPAATPAPDPGPAAAAAVDTGYPTTPPPAGPIEPAEFPPFQEATLSNGVRLVVVESRAHPVVSLALAFRAGESFAPRGKEGLPSMLAALLTKGAGQRSAEQIAEAIEQAGGSISAGAGADFLTVNAGGLSTAAPLAFELLGDVVARATLPPDEIELQRRQTLNGLRLAQGQPQSLAQRAFLSTVYGDHPYARQATPESVQGITREDLVRFRDTYLRPQGALLVVAGALSLDEARRLAEQAFRGWTGAPPGVAARPAPPARTTPTLVLVHRPGSVQSTIIVGNTTFGPTDERYYASVVANKILGQGSQGRLFQILREQRGWTYGAYSSLVRRAEVGYLAAQADVRTEVTDSALVELVAQLRRIGEEPVPADELETAKGTLVGQFPLTVETAEQVASAVLNARLYGLPDDYLRTYRTRLAAVQPAALSAAARTIARPGAGVMVVVGDGTRIYERIRDVAPVTILSVEGDTLRPEDLAAPALGEASALDASRLTPGRDSLAVLVQGNPFGSMVRTLAREGDGWVLTDSSVLAVAQQVTRVVLGPQLELRAVEQQGSVQGREMRIDVRVTDGRATGVAATPVSQFQEQPIEATLPPGAVDDNALATLVAALPLRAGASFTVPVFASGKGEVTPQRVVVAAQEEITVPAGTFQAFRLEVTGGAFPMTMWVSATAPYRTLKIAPVGQPVEMVLVK